jgi:hypothetical protein
MGLLLLFFADIHSLIMARKSSRKSTAVESRTRKGKKKTEGSASRPKRANGSKQVKPENPPLPQDSSSSDEIDEDYVEFLKTYVPEEDYPSDSPSKDEGSQITVEPKAKAHSSSKA